MGLEDNLRLPRNFLSCVNKRIVDIWTESGVWPDFIEAMSRTLSFFGSADDPDAKSANWALLPDLCCQAAGGQSGWADDLTTAWFLFYLAADLMDKIQDQDQAPWQNKMSTGVALNAVSGLYFTASKALSCRHEEGVSKVGHDGIVEEFYKGFLMMCSGQHRDLILDDLTLEKVWEIASAKSGMFFAMACWGGARLATDDLNRLNGYKKFGHHLGVLIQILDDLEEFKPVIGVKKKRSESGILKSLPVVYAMEVYPPSVRDHLRKCLIASGDNGTAYQEAIDLIDQSGAVLYVETEIEHHRSAAMDGLAQADPRPKFGDILNSLLFFPKST